MSQCKKILVNNFHVYKGMNIYSYLHGNLTVLEVNPNELFGIKCLTSDNKIVNYTKEGRYYSFAEGPCLLTDKIKTNESNIN